jgi:hypothetical protein
VKEYKKGRTYGKHIGKETHVEEFGGETPKKDTNCKTYD